MDQVFTTYSVLYLTTSLVSFFVALLAWQRRNVKGAIELMWLMIAAGAGSFCVMFETAALTVGDKVFWTKLEYLGGLSTPVLYLLFVLRFTGKERFITVKNIILLFVVPVITLLFAFTNERHHLIWTGFSEISDRTNIMEYYHGAWFWIGYISYSYIVLLLAVGTIIGFILNHKRNFRKQGWIVLTGGVIPWIISILYLTAGSPVPGLDLTPISITISGILAAYAIFYFKFLDLVPVARETLVEILPDGILALDAQNRIQDINEAALLLLGIKGKNVIGLDAESAGSSVNNLLMALVDDRPYECFETIVDGEIQTFRIIKQPIKNQSGSRLIIIRDISDRQRAEVALLKSISDLKVSELQLIKARQLAEESDKLKSAFLANMSHEIRTPMNGILGFTELLREPDLTPDEMNEYLDIIKVSGDRLINIINDIIELSKIESGQIKVTISNTDVNEQIDALFAFFKPEVMAKGIILTLNKTLEKGNSIVKTDKEKIYAILTNLIKNAVKFTNQGTIEVGYVLKDSFLQFYVKDTGIGIQPEHREIIFERFRQGFDTPTRNFEGTGLGLSISKAFAEILGGEIWFESEPGAGSVFYFTIPYLQDNSEKAALIENSNSKKEDHGLTSLVILIAEDDEPSQMYISKIVEPFGKKVIKVKTGTAAVQACMNNPDIDLVLMDIKMPQMDGMEATRQIRTFNKNIVIIAQTAFGLMGDKERIMNAGCNDYLSKPVNSTRLLEILRKYFSDNMQGAESLTFEKFPKGKQ